MSVQQTDPIASNKVIVFFTVSWLLLSHLCFKTLIFNSQQHGLTPSKSTETFIFKLIETSTVSLEEGDLLLGYFIDFSKALDSVIHNILLMKLEIYVGWLIYAL